MKKIIVAIDGYSSCGKSTMAKVLAKTVGYIYVDTGAMYRVATLYAMRNNMIQEVEGQKKVDEPALNQAIENGEIQVSFQLDPKTNLPLACLNGEVVENEIRTLEVSNNVSFVSALPFVREFLTQQQKNMGKKKGIVMDGRDIGTAVFPKRFSSRHRRRFVRSGALTNWWRKATRTSSLRRCSKTCRSGTISTPTAKSHR